MANGLLKAHSYCVLDAHRTQAGQKLIKVRNVWRSPTPWDGQYSEGSPDMTQELMDELDIDFRNSDLIWMSEQEFGQSFATLTTCLVRPEDETLRLKGEFLKGAASQQRAVERGVRSKYQYEV